MGWLAKLKKHHLIATVFLQLGAVDQAVVKRFAPLCPIASVVVLAAPYAWQHLPKFSCEAAVLMAIAHGLLLLHAPALCLYIVQSVCSAMHFGHAQAVQVISYGAQKSADRGVS